MIRIVSIAAHLPGPSLSTQSLGARLGMATQAEMSRTPVRTRHHVSAVETVTTLGALALEKLLAQSSLAPDGIDLLICASASQEQLMPSTATLIKRKMGWESLHMPCFDLNAHDLGYLHALEVAAGLIEAGRYARIVILNSEINSLHISPDDGYTFGLMGDGAVASLIERSPSPDPTPALTRHFAEGAPHMILPGGGISLRRTHAHNPPEAYLIQINPEGLSKQAAKHLPTFCQQAEAHFGKKLSDFGSIVFHHPVSTQLPAAIRSSSVHQALPRYGNCLAASLPLGLWDLRQSTHIPSGEQVLLLGIGAGMSIGAVVIEV